MRQTTPLCFILVATLLAAPALATHWEDFNATADCGGWGMTGMIVVGTYGIDSLVEYTVTLSRGGMTVQEHSGAIAFVHTGPSTVEALGLWDGELCGDYSAVGVFTIVGAGDLSGDPMRSFEVMFTCECDEPDACTYTPGFWKNHASAWPILDFAVGGVDYVQSELIGIVQRPVRGDATVILAHHLIAAMLNVWNGADDGIQGAIDAGNQFLADHGLGSRPSGDLKQVALAIKNELAAYNELECDDDDSADTMKNLPDDEPANWGTVKSIYR
ncbi:hypothetical protein KKG45_07950 [bacterium]|nr:hypothetical protein [bacterium]MBU1073165.1 hypothetical protein [bacterium]MBU1676333.1 hypothetical protein [bacterium]